MILMYSSAQERHHALRHRPFYGLELDFSGHVLGTARDQRRMIRRTYRRLRRRFGLTPEQARDVIVDVIVGTMLVPTRNLIRER